MENRIVDCDTPLLLSKDAVKRAEMRINFVTGPIKVFGLKQKLLTPSRHYCIPLGNHIENVEKQVTTNMTGNP